MKDDGGPAFPAVETLGYNTLLPGMSLRDYFAAMAISGFAHTPNKSATVAEYAEYAFSIADAMLAERSKAK